MRCAARWNRSVASSYMLQVRFCLSPPVSGKGKFPHRECERAPERWQTERLLRLSASLLSASFSSTSRHNQAVQPGLMNESKSFRWLQSGDAPTTHVREIWLWKHTKKLLIETRFTWECTCLKFDSTFATSDGLFSGLFWRDHSSCTSPVSDMFSCVNHPWAVTTCRPTFLTGNILSIPNYAARHSALIKRETHFLWQK